MRWGIVGYGSIGHKHAQNILTLEDELLILTKNKNCPFPSCTSVADLVQKFNAEIIIICNETSKHIDVYNEIRALSNDVLILVEKPIFDRAYNLKDDPKTFAAYCLRFHPLIEKIKHKIDKEKVISARFYVGQYLPDWRANRDYRNTYSAKKKLGGGVLRDLSHEIDLASYLLGDLTLDFAKNIKVSDLEIDCDDLFIGMFKTKTCKSVTIEMNYFDRVCQRDLTICTNDYTFKIDFVHGEFVTNQIVEKINYSTNEMYMGMLVSLKNKIFDNLTTFSESLKILDIFTQVENYQEEI